MLSLLLKAKINNLKRYFKTKKLAKLITAFLFFIVFLLVALGIYLFFCNGFNYINSDQYLKQAFTLYVYEIFFIILSLLIVFNSLIIGLFSLFRGAEDNWLISSPGYKIFPKYIFVSTCLSSTWPLFAIILPVLLAIRKVYNLNLLSLIMIFLAVILLIILITSLVFIGICLLCILFNKISNEWRFFRFTFKKLLTSIILSIILATIFIWHASVNTDLIKLFKAQNVTNTVISAEGIGQHFSYLPSHLVASAIFNWQQGNETQAWQEFIILLMLTGLFLIVFLIVAPIAYLPSWQKMREEIFYASSEKIGETKKRLFHFRGGQINSLFKKEALVAQRNIKNLLWAGFLLFVWLIQTIINIMLSKNIVHYELDNSNWPSIIQVMQFVTAIYFICAFVLRFVFPSFSTERKTSWILASAPLNYNKIFWAKYVFYLLVFTGLGLLIGYGNLFILNISWQMIGLSLFLFIVAIIFVITFGLSLGAIFPNFETDDPSALSTTLPGLGFTFITCLYGAIGGWLLWQALKGNSVLYILGFELISLVIIILLLIKALNSLNNKDFVKIIE
jgi:ABC-2 type transport system permease protein